MKIFCWNNLKCCLFCWSSLQYLGRYIGCKVAWNANLWLNNGKKVLFSSVLCRSVHAAVWAWASWGTSWATWWQWALDQRGDCGRFYPVSDYNCRWLQEWHDRLLWLVTFTAQYQSRLVEILRAVPFKSVVGGGGEERKVIKNLTPPSPSGQKSYIL